RPGVGRASGARSASSCCCAESGKRGHVLTFDNGSQCADTTFAPPPPRLRRDKSERMADMQRHRVCALAGVVFFLLPVVSVLGQGAQQISVETFYPRHAGPGRTTVINVAVPRGNEVQSAEISPPSGVTVAGIKGNAGATDQAIGWWELTLDVA